MIQFKIFAIISAIIMSGCAVKVIGGNLPEIQTFPQAEMNKTVIYRAYQTVSYNQSWIQIDPYGEDSQRLTEAIKNTGIFSGVTVYQPAVAKVILKGQHVQKDQEEVLKINFPIKADYFLDLRYENPPRGPHAYLYWGMIHILSLGLIPLSVSNDVRINATLYNRDGRILHSTSTVNKSTLWAWLPLFFFNDFKLFPNIDKTVFPIEQRAVENVIVDLIK